MNLTLQYYYVDLSNHAFIWRPTPSQPRGGEEETQTEATGSEPQLLFHGCTLPWLLQDNHSV